jgi:hypothetical protein
MELPEDPFKTAERFIQIRDKCLPLTWTAQLQRINDMILMPLITICLFFIGNGDMMMLLSTAVTAHRVWTEWMEYTELRFAMQRMRLRTAVVGGPFIVTNDPKYMPYVWADAVVRHQRVVTAE